MPLILVLGAQFGDEGKGKIVDLLAEKADIVVRFNGGDNAGHTVVVGEKTYKFHLMPSGAVHKKLCCLASGVAINPKTLADEIIMLKKDGKSPRLKIDSRAQIIMPYHVLLDNAMEEKAKIGTTKRGIGPCYADRSLRTGLRFCNFVEPKLFKAHLKKVLPLKKRELGSYNKRCVSERKILQEYMPLAAMLKRYEADVSLVIYEALKKQKCVLLEGAQGFCLDNDFGTYPYVTSSRTTAAGALLSAGVSHKFVERVIGVTKAYCTRVGSGPFVTELQGKLAEKIRNLGNEYGTTTGRPRRVGWLDMPMLRTASRICGFTELAVMKLDVLSGLKKIRVCEAYKCFGKKINELPASTALLEKCRPIYRDFRGFVLNKKIRNVQELPKEARAYLDFIEKTCGVPIRIISYGPERTQTIFVKKS